MSEIVGELARMREAFDKPTLQLLRPKMAPLVLAVFKTSFGRDQQSVAAERLHAQVEAYLDELSASGEEVPAKNGRALCVQWMGDQWLVRNISDGQEEYALTSHALEALDLLQTLSGERALISESRITTILATARHWATEANPDRQARIDRLDAQIRQLTRERDRLAEGGAVVAASDARMRDGYTDMIDLIGALPSDFKRVEESVLGMHRRIIDDFRHEDRPIGQVLDEYLHKSDELTTATPEGRAFEGAVALLRDEAMLLDLRFDLDTILSHPFARSLTTAQRREFHGAVNVIRRGINDVLAQRSRLTGTLREHIVHHDVLRDRELDELLRRINQQLGTWMQTAGPRATVPLPLMPTTVEISHLRERFWDPAAAAPPPPLADVSEDAPVPLDLATIRTHGGPSFPQLREHLQAATTPHSPHPDNSGTPVTLAALFNTLPDDLRRPVEILGALHLLQGLAADDPARDPTGLDSPRLDGPALVSATIATQVGTPVAPDAPAEAGSAEVYDGAEVEVYEAIRPDGTHQQFWGPRRVLSPAHDPPSPALQSSTSLSSDVPGAP